MRHAGPKWYIATAEARDAEMAARIARHQTMRGDGWHTLEEPRDLAQALRDTDGQGVRLIDCLTLWLSNVMFEDQLEMRRQALLAALGAQRAPVILVTNELGMGIVPENALARAFRDAHGWTNQNVAAVADEVWMAVSGQPLRLKPQREMP